MRPAMPTKTMTSKTCDAARAAAFLADYCAWLLGCGATCIRIEKNARRMARAFGFEADLCIMPAHVHVAVGGATAMSRAARCGISFSLNARLSRLSWAVADGRCGLQGAVRRLERIKRTPPAPRAEVLVLASVANASFCRLFGGDAVAMAIVLLATMAGFRLRQLMIGAGRDVRAAVFCAAFFSASLSAAGHVFGLGSTPEIALATSVLYLIPGVPYINAVSDMLDRHYLCAFSRFCDAAVLTGCLAAGLCGGIFLLDLKWF